MALTLKIGIAVFLASRLSLAEDINTFVLNTVANGTSYIGQIGSKNVVGYFMGKDHGCYAVSMIYHTYRVDHYRVCDGDVRPRSTVAPIYPRDEPGAIQLIKKIQNEAMMRGHANSAWDGYSLKADRLNSESLQNCSWVEVLISYDFDLVDVIRNKVCVN